MQIRYAHPRHGSQEFRLHAQDVPVAATEMQNRFNAGLLLNDLAGYLGTQTSAGARPIGHVDAIDTVLFAKLRASHFLGRVHSARGQNLNESHNLPAASLAPNWLFSATGTLEELLDGLFAFYLHFNAGSSMLHRLQ